MPSEDYSQGQPSRPMTAMEQLQAERPANKTAPPKSLLEYPPAGCANGSSSAMGRLIELEAQMREIPETLALRIRSLENRVADLEKLLTGQVSPS